MRAPNERLRAAIRQAGSSYDALARTICSIAYENGDQKLRCNKSSVAHWVAGSVPSGRTSDYIAEALSRKLGHPVSVHELGLSPNGDEQLGLVLTDDPVDVVVRLGRAELDRRGFLGTAAYSLAALAAPLEQRREIAGRARRARQGGAVGRAEVDTVREVTAMFTRIDERHGGDHARSAVVQYLTGDVAVLCAGRFRRERGRREMFGAAAQLAYLVGWKAFDAGEHALAQRYYLQAFQLAEESDPDAHAAYVLRILAHHAMEIGHRDHCVDLAEAAWQRVRGKVDAETASLFVLTRARAHAVNGARRPAADALNEAEAVLARSRGEAPPFWCQLGGPAEARLASHAGKSLVALGDHGAAERQFRRSASAWNAGTHPRIHGLTLAKLAEVQCAQGRVEEACATWATALDGIRGVRSARTVDARRRMRRELTAFRGRGIPAVSQLLAYDSA